MKKETEFKILNKLSKQKILKHTNIKWILTILIITFTLTFILSFISDKLISDTNILVSIIVLIIFIFLGIIFDIIGVAVTTANESTFHSMNSRKVFGAKKAIKYKKNAEKVSSFCCDVIGDICGIISGSAGVMITLSLVNTFNFNLLITSLLITSIISSLTIGGKAIGKSFAINKSDVILYEFAKIISLFKKDK